MDLTTSVSNTMHEREDDNHSFMYTVPIEDEADDSNLQSHHRRNRSSEASDNSELPNIEHVPYLLESDCLLTESANLSNQAVEDVYNSAAMSHHSYSQTLPNIANECLHNYSQPVNRNNQVDSDAEILHNYSQPWPQNTDSFTSVHNYCITNLPSGHSKETQLNHDTKIFKLANKDRLDEAGSCLKLQMIDTIVCQWMDCGLSFPSVKTLSEHVLTHIKSQTFGFHICQWRDCPRNAEEFDARYKLINHVRRHTSEKPHKCSFCQAEFSTSEGLTKHQRVHTGEKPYACPYPDCDKAFRNSGDRHKHVQAHKTRYPYPCKYVDCDRKYTDPGSLRKHVRRIHGTAIKGPDSSPVHIEQKIQSASLVSSTGAETALDITGLSVLSFRGALISEEEQAAASVQSQAHNYSKPSSAKLRDERSAISVENSQDTPLDLTTAIVPVSVNEIDDTTEDMRQSANWMNFIS